MCIYRTLCNILPWDRVSRPETVARFREASFPAVTCRGHVYVADWKPCCLKHRPAPQLYHIKNNCLFVRIYVQKHDLNEGFSDDVEFVYPLMPFCLHSFFM